MTLRRKLLILMLVVAPLPLLVVNGLMLAGVVQFGRTSANEARTNLTDQAVRTLGQTVSTYGEQVRTEAELIETILELQATQMEQALAQAGDPAGQSSLLFDTDFDDLEELPDHVGPSTRHVRLVDGQAEPMWVSLESQVVRLSPGVSAEAVADDLSRVGVFVDTYRSIYERHEQLILWQYTTLASGVHTSYPGKGGYSPTYEPRERPWYTQTVDYAEEAQLWFPPLIDETTQQVVLTTARPIQNEAGRTVGVTAVDVLMSDVLRSTRLPAAWADQAEAMVVLTRPHPEVAGSPPAKDRGAFVSIVMRESQIAEHDGWKGAAELSYLYESQCPEVPRIAAELVAGREGVADTTLEGEASLIGYAPLGEDAALLIVVPKVAVTQEAEALAESVNGLTRQGLQRGVLVLGAGLVILGLVAWRTAREVTHPVEALAEAAERVAEGDLDARVELEHDLTELDRMGQAFNTMVPRLREHVEMSNNLSLAKEVQQSLLPDAPPEFPRLELAGYSDYCDETGGDYYDYMLEERPHGRQLAVALGDVTGHGVAPALLMCTARALLRSEAEHIDSPAELIGMVNRQLMQSRFLGRFMTLFYMEVREDNGALRWVSAGHDPAIVYLPDEDRFDELAGSDIPLGVDRDWSFNLHEREALPAGAWVVLGTDGIWECQNAEEEMFGKDRLRGVIRANAEASAEAMLRAILDAVETFRGGHTTIDDVTAVIIRVRS